MGISQRSKAKQKSHTSLRTVQQGEKSQPLFVPPGIAPPAKQPPLLRTPELLLQLQQVHGNQAVQRMLQLSKPHGSIQRLKPGEEIPSLADQAHKRATHTPLHNKRIKGTLPLDQQQMLSALLLGTLFGKSITGNLHDEYIEFDAHQRMKAARDARWRDNKLLQTNIQEVGRTITGQSGYVAMGDGGNLYEAALKQADNIIRQIVDPEILQQLNAPKVTIGGERRDLPKYRAHKRGDGIFIASDDQPEIIVHEVGHYLEDNLSPALWNDVAFLREYRHSQSASMFSKRKAGAIPANQEPDEGGQGRYQGEYPATGEYTSKVYEAIGSTEVVSMTMEYLATPDKAKLLMERDPIQALIVLRHLRPHDSEIQTIAHKFEDYLPNAL